MSAIVRGVAGGAPTECRSAKLPPTDRAGSISGAQAESENAFCRLPLPCRRTDTITLPWRLGWQVLAQGQSKKRKAPDPKQKTAADPPAPFTVAGPSQPPPPAPPRAAEKRRTGSTAADAALKDILADLDGAPVARDAHEPVSAHVASIVQQRLRSAPASVSVDGAIAAVESALSAPPRGGKGGGRKPRGRRKQASVPDSAAAVSLSDPPGTKETAAGCAEGPERTRGGRPRRAWVKASWESPVLGAVTLPEPLEALDALFAKVAVHYAALAAQRITVTASGLAEALRWEQSGLAARETLLRMVCARTHAVCVSQGDCSSTTRYPIIESPVSASCHAFTYRLCGHWSMVVLSRCLQETLCPGIVSLQAAVTIRSPASKVFPPQLPLEVDSGGGFMRVVEADTSGAVAGASGAGSSGAGGASVPPGGADADGAAADLRVRDMVIELRDPRHVRPSNMRRARMLLIVRPDLH